MSQLILLRHGESEWNRLNRFTGWVDVPLSIKGIEEAFEAGKKIKDIPIDLVFTSTLVRAQMTAAIAMTQHSQKKTLIFEHEMESDLTGYDRIVSPEAKAESIPVLISWHLNERMYGDLQGLNKADTIAKYGAEQVKLWRRSFDIAPPNGESLKTTSDRTIPYFKEVILPHLQQGKNVLISAHGNSLRSIVMYLDRLSKQQVVELEIPTGAPLFYSF